MVPTAEARSRSGVNTETPKLPKAAKIRDVTREELTGLLSAEKFWGFHIRVHVHQLLKKRGRSSIRDPG
jgi:hypothetical protein